MDIMRHVAKVANTDQRCVVVFMQIPNDETNSLIIPVDGLHPRVEQAIMQVLKSPEGQQEETFCNVLHRHRMPDTGETILAALHKTGKLVKMPVANIIMLPQPNNPIKLTDILTKLGRMPEQLHEAYSREKFNPYINNQQATATESVRVIARGLVMEAEMLEMEARKKRDQAYMQDPSLRPAGGVTMMSLPDPSMYSFDNEPKEGFQTAAVSVDNGFDKRLQAIEEALPKILSVKAELDASKEETE